MHSRLLMMYGLGLLLLSCVKDKVEDPVANHSLEYFPLSLGHFIEYQVDSIVFDDAPGGNRKDTVTFQLREEITSVQLLTSTDTVYYIHRFRRNQPEHSWSMTDVWTARYHENNALRTEENLTFRKMTFPLRKGLRWIATSYIHPQTSVRIGTENVQAYENWEASVLDIDQEAQIGAFQFPAGQVMHIRQVDSDGTMRRFVHESYARGIGLVARTDTILDSRCIELGDFGPCLGKEWTEHASKGYILSQVMISHN